MHCLSREGSHLVNAHCEVREDDQKKKESYEVSWVDLVMETEPEHRQTLCEKDAFRRVSYEQRQVVNFLIQRNPDQRLRLGKHGGTMTEYQLPFRTPMLVPLFKPSPASPWDSHRAISPSYSSNGVCFDKQDVSVITKDLPKLTKPILVNFKAESLISPEFFHERVRSG
ncbi:telethonin [Aplochiton taeniatus]